MHMEFPHNILKREKENGVPSFSGTGDVENITYPVSQRGCPFFRYVSSLAGPLRLPYNYFDLDFGKMGAPVFPPPQEGTCVN